jgi:pimeloyl-ACP methyl ester carboxylesterase
MDVPTLVIHGDDDRTVPLAASGNRTAGLIKGLDSWSSREARTASTPKR